MLSCYNVAMLQCFYVTILRCYDVTILQCYKVIMLQSYNVQSYNVITRIPITCGTQLGFLRFLGLQWGLKVCLKNWKYLISQLDNLYENCYNFEVKCNQTF